jgi:hypothetical protein
VKSRPATSCHVLPHSATSCHVLPCPATSCHVPPQCLVEAAQTPSRVSRYLLAIFPGKFHDQEDAKCYALRAANLPIGRPGVGVHRAYLVIWYQQCPPDHGIHLKGIFFLQQCCLSAIARPSALAGLAESHIQVHRYIDI